MRAILFFSFLLLSVVALQAQQIHVDSLQPDTGYENVCNKKIYSDSLTTTFVIWVKKEVPLHKHALHTEQVIVLEGSANMLIGDEWKAISKGDVILIPKGMPHAVTVTSEMPLKVISIQSPQFDGTDRILLNN